MTTINQSCAQVLNIALSNIANVQSITVDIDAKTKITINNTGFELDNHDIRIHMDNPKPFLLRDRFIIEDEYRSSIIVFWILDE